METVCCVCKSMKTAGGWIRLKTVKNANASHGYCPECFQHTMEKVQNYFMADSVRETRIAG